MNSLRKGLQVRLTATILLVMLLFGIGQALYIARHLPREDTP